MEAAFKQGEQYIEKFEKHTGKNDKLRKKFEDMKAKWMPEKKEVSFTHLASTSDSDIVWHYFCMHKYIHTENI